MTNSTILEQRPWLKHYQHSIPAEIDVQQYNSLLEMLEESFKKYASLPAFSNMGKTMTYSEIDKLSNQFGAFLQSKGLKKGDRIAIMMPNLLQYPIALFGAFKAGLVVVNTNPLYTPREMEHQLTDAGATAIVILENFAHNLEKILLKTNIKLIITTSIGEMLPFLKRSIVNYVVRKVKKMVPAYSLPSEIKFGKALAEGSKLQLQRQTGTHDDVILLQYTGGTTGVSKGAMLTNRNMIANMLQGAAFMSPFTVEGKETMLCPLPIYHIFAFTMNVLIPMNGGFHSVLVTNPREIKTVVEAFKKYPISMMTGVNTLFNALVNNEDFKKLDFSKLKIAGAGGMALQRAVAEKWLAVTKMSISEGFGMTESSPLASINPFDETARLGTVGIPVPSTEMRIVDNEGNVLAPEEVGEIQIKGPQVMAGYYNRPSATAETIKDGWLSTGDIGAMTEDGYFRIVDRKKDMILVSGFNVYPNEIEDVVAAHPKVLEAAAIGVLNEKTGEAVKLFIVKKDESLTKEELIDYCKENLTAYKVPKLIEFRTELPKTNVGKILRKNLRES